MNTVNPPRNALAELQAWHAKQCDGEWERSYGITIQSHDLPGWRLRVDLAWTALDGRPFEPVEKNQKKRWVMCHVIDDKFVGTCDLESLEELILTFVDWARDSE
jgi:hypothetical protein